MGRVTAVLVMAALQACTNGQDVLSGALFGAGTGCGPFPCVSSGDAGATPDASTDSCSSRVSCESCTALSGCGFCYTGAGCRRGTSLGPSDGACASTEWKWLIRTCGGGNDPCSVNSDCSACSHNAACGYCTNGAGCLTGDSLGPQGGQCDGTQWVPHGFSCGCAIHGSCLSCVSDGFCGYCNNGEGCLEGGSTGPSNGACASFQWSFLSGDCP